MQAKVTALVQPVAIPTVKARKRARRAPDAPKPKAEVMIDLARMSAEQAKKALTAAFPRPIAGKVIEATEASAKSALEYLNARDAESIASGRKEAAGNALRLAMGDAEEIHGDGWKATWALQKAEIDWSALCKECNIPAEVIEQFRKPQRRVLNVRETAEE